MNLKSKKVFVTGAGGFIGSHLVEALLARECRVKALVQYNSKGLHGWLENIDCPNKDSLEIVLGDVRDPNQMKELTQDVQVIFNLAALIAIPYSYSAPDSYIDTNVKGALNIVQAARTNAVEKVVQVSTSEVYGTAQIVPIPETHILRGQSPYAASKIGADQIAMSFYHAFGTPVSVIRPFNTFGPRQSARAVIPTIISQIASGERQIKLGSISPTRDFTYVADTASGIIQSAEKDGSIGEVINLGTGYEFSIGKTAETIAKMMNVQIEIKTDNERIRPDASEVERLCSDNSKAARILDWQPSLTGENGFEQGLKKTIDWFSNASNLALYRTKAYNK